MKFRIWPVLAFCFFVPFAFANPLPNAPHIYVEGSAEIEVEPDTAIFTLYLESVDRIAEVAKKEIDVTSKSLVELAQGMGIETDDISATGISVRQKYEYDQNTNQQVFKGVTVSRYVNLTLTDLKNYNEIAHQLVSSGLAKNVSSTLEISDEKSVTDKVLEQALKDATARAKSLATIQGRELGEVHSISEFDLRRSERYELRISRGVSGESVSTILESKTADNFNRVRAGGLAESAQLLAVRNQDPFNAGNMTAGAKVYVVFLLD